MRKPRWHSMFCLPAAALLGLPLVVSGSAQPLTPSSPELVLQTGHTAAVISVAFGPGGRWLVSGGGDKVVRLWEVAAGRELRTLTGHTSTVWAVAVSSDGRWVASASQDRTVKLWEAATGREARTLGDRTAVVEAVAFSPDGRWLASASADRVTVWDVVTGQKLRTLAGHTKTVKAVVFSPDGRWVASGSWDETIRLWDAVTGQELRRLANPGSLANPRYIDGLAFSPDGRRLASAGHDHTVRLWDVVAGAEVATLVGHTSHVTEVAFSPDGRWIASASDDRTVRLWEVATGREARILGGHSRFNGVAFSPDGRWLASPSVDGTVKVWDMAKGQELPPLAGHTSQLNDVALAPDGRWLAVGSRDKVRLWETTTGREAQALGGHTGTVLAVAFSPDGRWLAWSAADRTVRVWELSVQRVVRTLAGGAVAFSPDGRRLASASGDETVKVWEPTTGSKLGRFDVGGHPYGNARVAFSPDGRWLASASSRAMAFSPDGRWLAADGGTTVKLWEVVSGREFRALADPDLVAAAHSPDQYFAALAWLGETVKLWDVTRGQELRTLTGHTRAVWAVAFSPDGRWLASASLDHTVRIWDVLTGREVRTLAGHTDAVTAVAFTPDGHQLVSVSWDGSARIWDPRTGEHVASLVSLREDGEWLVVTPDGLFDGSPAAWDRILWRFRQNTFAVVPVEVFFNEFFYPGLLADILAGKRPAAARSIAQLDRRQPEVKLELPAAQTALGRRVGVRTVRVRIDVTEAPADREHAAGSGARDVRLFRNGSLARVWRGDVLRGSGGKVALGTTIPIVAGENRLAAYAFNRDNVKSADATLLVTGAESLKRPGTAYVLAVGVNQYANRGYNLRYAVADAKAFGQELRRQQTNLGTFARIGVILLLDRDATKANILRALKRLAGTEKEALPPGTPAVLEKIRPAEPEDAVFVYFAGHGIAHRDRFYLIPHDLGYRGTRTALDEAGLKTILAHSISDLELEHAFEKADAGRLLLVIDACNSGQALEAEEKRRGPMNSKGLAQLAYEKGMYILTAAQGYQAALEAVQLGHGLLTYALVEEGLKTPAADATPPDGLVSVREWLDYARRRVPGMQRAMMEKARALGRELAFVDGEETISELGKRSLQHPRVFYRREPEVHPLIVAKPEGTRQRE